MSRYTNIGNGITRSLGEDEETDFVVEIRRDGMIVVREEPLRRLRRGEKLPEVVIDPWEAWRNRTAAQVMEPETWVDALIRDLPVAKFEGENPSKVAYAMKVWLLEELKAMR